MASGILQLPCLGRPFHLGMLYDCRRDKLIPGISLWDASKLKSALQSRPQPCSIVKIIAEDNMRMKSSSLGIKGSLKLSILGGLVNVSGAAEYIDDRKSSQQQARVTLKYSSTSRFDELSMEQIKGIQYPDVLEDSDATHVVTGVIYGSDAFFVFDRTVMLEEKNCDIHGKVEAMVKVFSGISGSGSGSVSSKTTQREEVEKLNCTFYGDLILESNPSSYAEAIKLYGELPALVLKGDSVAKEVYMYPISALDSRQQKIIRTIDQVLITKVEEVMEFIHDIEIQCKDLKKCDECFKFCDINSQITKFLSLLKEFKMEFVEKLSELLPKIRGTGAEEKDLADLVLSIHKSPFNSKELTSYVKRKGKELSQLVQYLKKVSIEPKVQHVFSSEGRDLSVLTTDYQYEYVICFAFNVTSEETAFTRKLESYLSTGETVAGLEHEWFDEQHTLKSLRVKSKIFQEFVKTNAKREDLAFAVTDKNEETDSSGPAIILYSNGEPMDFNPPGKPGCLLHDTIRDNSIDLVWSAPDEGAASIQSYNVFYGPNEASMSWSKMCTVSKEEKIHIDGLSPSMEYCFKVEAVSIPGVSMESSVYKVTTLPPSMVRPADDLVKQSDLIKDSSPLRYQLPLTCTMEDTKNNLFKFEIGSSNLSSRKPERVLMMVGATGAGKSTLINGLANYVLGVKWEDSFRFQVITGEGDRSQAQSQTKQISAYTFHSTILPYVLTIIDTPGFGDTDGIENDQYIAKQIKNFFSKKGIDQLHGIGFVAQASLARLTPTQKYIFDAVLSIFGKDIGDNIFLMTTFADASEPPVLVAAKAEIPYKESFKFNNSAIFACNDTKDDFNHMFWKMGTTSFAHFISSFSHTTVKSLKMTREVLEERGKLETFTQSLQKQVHIGLSQLDEIEQEKKVLEQHEAEINANKNFNYRIKVNKHRKIPLKGVYTTNCLTCSFTCHDNCAFSNDADKERCSAMSNGNCRACPGKCHWRSHSNTPYYFEYYDDYEDRTYDDLKIRYETAQLDRNKCSSMISTNGAILVQLQVQLYSLLEQTRSSILRLDEIALRPNPLSDIEYIDLLIESETRTHKTGWQNRVKQYEKLRQDAEVLKKVPDVSHEDAEVSKKKDVKSSLSFWQKWTPFKKP